MDKLFRKIVTPNYYKSCDGKFDKSQFNKLLEYREEINKHLINVEKQKVGVFQVIEEKKTKKKRVYTTEEVKEFGSTYYETHKVKILKQAKERNLKKKEEKVTVTDNNSVLLKTALDEIQAFIAEKFLTLTKSMEKTI